MKKPYIHPQIDVSPEESDSLLTTASPGVDGEYDPNLPIGAKEGTPFDAFGNDEEFEYEISVDNY